MTIILTFPDTIKRDRLMAWLQRALDLCPYPLVEVAVEKPKDELTELH